MKQPICFVPWKEANFFINANFANYCCKVEDFVHIDKVRSGRDFLSNEHLTELRTALLDGYMPEKYCGRCIRAEEQGRDSWRLTEGVILPELRDHDFSVEESHWSYIAVYFDNTCDNACLYCSPGLSSKWLKESIDATKRGNAIFERDASEKFTTLKDVEYKVRIDMFEDFLIELGKHPDKQSHTNIAFLGGEPFLSPELREAGFMKYIDAFYTHAPHDYNLIFTIHSNANTPQSVLDRFMNDVQISKQKYSNLQIKITLSVDTTGRANEYIRWGSNWDTIAKNTYRYYTTDFIDQMSFSPTLSVLNITTFNTLIEFWHKLYTDTGRPIDLSIGTVLDPMSLSPYNLTKDYVVYVEHCLMLVDKYKDSFTERGYKLLKERLERLGAMLSESESVNPEQLEDLKRFIDYARDVRGVDVHDYIPDFLDGV